jgi:hypothetical protein
MSAQLAASAGQNVATLTELVVSVSRQFGEGLSRSKPPPSDETAVLREMRKQATSKQERATVSKQLAKSIRRDCRHAFAHKLDQLIEKGSSGKHLRDIRRPKGKARIAQIKDEDGVLTTSRAGIVEVFAKFYESLYHTHIQAVPMRHRSQADRTLR